MAILRRVSYQSRAPVALIRFYVRGGARVAQRNALFAIGAIIIAVGSAPTPPEQMLRELALSLGARGIASGAALVVTALAAGLAAAAVPTLLLGLGGWMRSVALDGSQHRRAITLALLAPMMPLLAIALAIALCAAVVYHVPLAPAKLAGMPLAALGAAAAAVPSTRGIAARPLAMTGALAASLGRWDALVLALVLLAVADVIAGPIALPPRTSARRPVSSRARRGVTARRIALGVAWRAIGWRSIAALVPGLLLIGWAHLYRVNNELSRTESAGALRLCALIGIVLIAAAAGDLLLIRRPAWPWARSLPWSSRRRVTDDALAIGALALPIVALVAREDWRTALVVAATLPLLSALAAGAARRGRGRMSRGGGEMLALGALVAATVSAWPALALACLAVAPLAVLGAARSERRAVVTAWDELHHAALGDSLAGSAR